ncbi:hypothetical protein ACSSV6_004183 [Roseovarius sp. MBR-38]|jgi:hypothetical protein
MVIFEASYTIQWDTINNRMEASYLGALACRNQRKVDDAIPTGQEHIERSFTS